jgi:FixJ family two-component response regulator
MNASLRVHVIDDNADFRRSTRWLLESDGIAVEESPSAEEYLARQPGAGAAELLLVDLRMPGMSGLQLQDALAQRTEAAPIIFMTAHGDVSVAVEAMRKGALNFLEKPFSDDALLGAVRAAFERLVSRREQGGLAEQAAARVRSLTPRERQVLELVLEGALNKTIAGRLGISIKTVELHRAHMMEKMQARSIAQLVQLAVAARG